MVRFRAVRLFRPIIGNHFFPAANSLTSLLQTYGVFAAGFLTRPLGAVVFDYIGDRFGRSRALVLSVIMMGAPTFCLACFLATTKSACGRPVCWWSSGSFRA
ncbi:MAG: hypothetical protein P8Z80_06980 [Pseudolabrys sp.]|jgi:MFS family permease